MNTKIWKDETGLVIPANRVKKSEKLRESVTDRLLAKAIRLNRALNDFKTEIANASDQVFSAVVEENGGQVKEDRKGNFLFYNFDRSIKIETDAQERIEFDDALITVAKQHFDEFIKANSSGIDEMIRQLILDAFNTTRGKLDTKKVMNLVRYRQRIPADKYPSFHLAIDAIEKSISRPESKRYYRISQRDSEGKYQPIDLNFSSI